MRKIFIFTVLGLIAYGVLVWLAFYLSSGTITVTSSSGNTITLQSASNSKSYIKSGTGSLTANIKHGLYIATVKKGSEETEQVIDFKDGHKKLNYSVPLVSTSNVEPVAYQNAKDLVVNSSQLYYINTSLNNLAEIDSQNNNTNIDVSQNLQTIKWADTSFGVGESSSDHLYTVINGSISPLNVPFSYNGEVVEYDVSPNKQIYISQGANVYVGDQTGNFKKIYTASSANPVIKAGSNDVAVADTTQGANASNISKPLLAVINSSGKVSEVNVEAENMAWSPNGQYLAVVNEASPVIYNSSLQQVASLPTTTDVGQFVWLNNSTLYYSMNDQLWEYNLSDQRSELVSTMPGGDNITGLRFSDDGSYLYLITYNANTESSSIRRLGLNGQIVPSYIYQLQNALPENLSDYSINMINFTQPAVIVVRPLPSAPSGNYTQQASAELSGQGIDVSNLQFQLDTQRILGE